MGFPSCCEELYPLYLGVRLENFKLKELGNSNLMPFDLFYFGVSLTFEYVSVYACMFVDISMYIDAFGHIDMLHVFFTFLLKYMI